LFHIYIYWTSLSLLTYFGLKSTFSDMSISHILLSVSTCLVYDFSYSHFQLVRCVSFKQQIVESCDLIEPVNRCLLITELRSFTFYYWQVFADSCNFVVVVVFSWLIQVRFVLFFLPCSLRSLLVYFVEYVWLFPSSYSFYLFLSWNLFLPDVSCLWLSSSSLCRILLNVFWNADLVVINCFSLCVSWKLFISSSI
jgi:hypothetical protein